MIIFYIVERVSQIDFGKYILTLNSDHNRFETGRNSCDKRLRKLWNETKQASSKAKMGEVYYFVNDMIV